MSTLRANQIQTVAGKPLLNSTGSILNVAYSEYTTSFANSVVHTYQIFYSLPITATASNSRYLLIGNAHSYNATTDSRCNIGYSVTISGTTTRIVGVDGITGDSWGYPSNVGSGGCYMNRQAIYTSSASAGTTLTFNFLVGCFEGLGQYNFAGYNHKSTFTVMEISA